MDKLFDLTLSSSIGKGFEPLNYEDIKGSDELAPGPSWKDFLTPNRSTTSLNYSSISSLTSSEIMNNLAKVRESVHFVKSHISEGPVHFEEFIPNPPTPSQSNEFLRKKASNARSSLEKSAQSIVDFALTGKSEDGLPDELNLHLVVETLKKAQKTTQKKVTVEQLMRFIKSLNNEDLPCTPKTGYQSEMGNSNSKDSKTELVSLKKALEVCQIQIKAFQQAMVESMGVIFEINNKWAADRNECEQLKEQLKKPKESNPAVIKEVSCQYSQTEDKLINDLTEQNKQLKQQLKENFETLEKVEKSVINTRNLEKALQEKETELDTIKKDKQELVEAVEQLVESAQKIMASSKGSKQQKLRMFAEMMGSLKSMSISDLHVPH